MNSDFETLVKGALLHDIGKVIQRASDQPTAKKHTQWGYDWLKDNLSEEEPCLNAANTHHKTDDVVFETNFSLIWYQADNLASGERKEEDEKLEESKWDPEVPLASPFSRIHKIIEKEGDNKELLPPALTYMPLLTKNLIPEASKEEFKVSKEDYKHLLQCFEKDFMEQEVPKPHSIDFLLMLFEKHFSTVPSTTLRIQDSHTKNEVETKRPDIPLFDHSKMTAAIAGCMYHYYSQKYPDKWKGNDLLKDEILNVPADEELFLLIGGDISGVQKFIYTITSKGALKALKGRSFFLELLTEHIVSELLEELGLTRCNLIYSGGGHFYILSHNTDSAIKAISEVKERMDADLLERFKGDLQVHFAYEPFGPEVFKGNTNGTKMTSNIFEALSKKLEESKKRKWEGKLNEVLKVESPYDKGSDEENCLTRSCEICFRDDKPLKDLRKEEDDEVIKVCEYCKAQYELGGKLSSLAKGEFSLIYKFDEKPEGESIEIGNKHYLLKKSWDEELQKKANAVYRINDLRAKHYSHENSIYLPIGIYQHEKMTDLSKVSGELGVKRIAVLRMDVDNLGKIFGERVPKEDRTFSRMASISRNLNYFFKYYLNTIV